MPYKPKRSHKYMIALNAGASKNETKRSEECIDRSIYGILILQNKLNKR